ncbi:MAG: hypothetical protein NVS3B1_07760 [Marmoricola sp.]
MARRANLFVDPNGVRANYSWPVNHHTEEPTGKHRNIRYSAPTAHVGLVKHLGDTDPLILRWKGSIFTRAQLVEMLKWFALCEQQTIYLTDFAGDAYEVLIVHFDPVRVALGGNPRDPVNAPNWKWEYTIEFTIIQMIAGTWFEAGVAP